MKENMNSTKFILYTLLKSFINLNKVKKGKFVTIGFIKGFGETYFNR